MDGAAFLPLLIMGTMVGLVLFSISKRKSDTNNWIWFLLGFVPGIAFLAGMWLASLPDRSTKEELEQLRLRVQQLEKSLGVAAVSPESGVGSEQV